VPDLSGFGPASNLGRRTWGAGALPAATPQLSPLGEAEVGRGALGLGIGAVFPPRTALAGRPWSQLPCPGRRPVRRRL
jgi:hypothetical protein